MAWAGGCWREFSGREERVGLFLDERIVHLVPGL
jgi:hypothetical protein